MSSVSDALRELGVRGYVLQDEPRDEASFNRHMQKEVINNGVASLSNNPADFGVTWSQVETKLNELRDLEPTKILRFERDNLLTSTDHWALSDRTMTQEQIDYRQALRDITKVYTSLDDVVWPTKPAG